jgi:ABC-type multidrug transport system fused ATPase/permease subunit
VFRGSIMQNITLGQTWCTVDHIKEAVEAVGLTKYIQSLELGYETMLMPGAKNLPRSITSKILLARCIVARPQLLSVIDSFRFLDDKEYDYLVHYLTDQHKPWTLLIISDDPYLASKCDRILIFKDGVIIEDNDYTHIEKSVHFEHVFKNKLKP